MALELRQQLKLSQKLVMTQQLRQAIQLLQLNRLELSSALRDEIEKNPALEEDFSTDESSFEEPNPLSTTDEGLRQTAEPEITEGVSIQDTMDTINWQDYANNFDSNFSFSRETPPADAPSQFDFISEKPGLTAYLHWQLSHCDLSEEERETATYVIGNLNRYGFLEVGIEQITEHTGCSHDDADYIIEVIQELDPPGICARDVSESLYLQLERRGEQNSLAATIVKEHLPLLETRNLKELARVTGKKKPELERAIQHIVAELTPFPGLPYNNDDTSYIAPDVYVRLIDGEYVIQLNDEDLPRLKLSSEYQALLNDDRPLSKESRQYLSSKLKNADWFIKSLYQRQRTIYRVMESILRFQYEFFEKGPEYLKPLVLKDVAEDLELHESTISRVTSNKYAHTPQGIYELKYFFSTAIPCGGGSSLASESIKTMIGKMIREEEKTSPLSDKAISEMLAAQDIQIARRTVAKYREQLKILPAKHRRHKR
ncbi:MAG: RNA polymerase sigma-54 factor [Deltaproteobacteria bacterium]|nr:MAG: RNA polymerase sigma-54 factor [Desulfobacterales bacterium]PIE72494.1 MAG: RNA polymerase sigma-54 factor [Deltaproteobacteria bacterium]